MHFFVKKTMYKVFYFLVHSTIIKKTNCFVQDFLLEKKTKKVKDHVSTDFILLYILKEKTMNEVFYFVVHSKRKDHVLFFSSEKKDHFMHNQNFIKNSMEKKKNSLGIIYIKTTKNNTIITLTDTKGNCLATTSCGSIGFKNSRKSTTYAAQAAADTLARKAIGLGYHFIQIKLKGLGFSKESTVRVFYKLGLTIVKIQDITPIVHNGCRLSKQRRV